LDRSKEITTKASRGKQADLLAYAYEGEEDSIRNKTSSSYYFEGLPASDGERLLTGYPNIDPEDIENWSPKAKDMIEIAKKHDGYLIGIVVVRPKKEARITITGFVIKADKETAADLRKKLAKKDQAPDEFKKFGGKNSWRFWWD
jgi:hypothetical protein